jgi:type III secretion protein T
MEPLVVLVSALEALAAPFSALGLGAARLFGLMAVLPVFSRLGLRAPLRGGVAVALALPLVPVLTPQLAQAPPGAIPLALLGLKEALVGLVLGLVVSLPFRAAEAAGELIDQQRGSPAEPVADSSGAGQGGTMATLLSLASVAVFHAAGGMESLLAALYESWRLWPPLEPLPRPRPDTVIALLNLLDQMVRAGFVLAAPVVSALVLTDVAVALAGRATGGRFGLDGLAPVAKGLVFALSLLVYAAFLVEYLGDGLAPAFDATARLREVMP